MDGFLSEIITGARDFFVTKEQTRQQIEQTRIAERASLNALSLRDQQIRALAVAGVAAVGLILLLRSKRGR